MSISSSDHTVMPENDEAVQVLAVDEDVTAVAVGEAAVSASADADTDDDTPAEPTLTFGDLGLPEGIVRKLAQNGVTAPFPIQAATLADRYISDRFLPD
ncbi:hypothetical protein ACFRLW_04445, partial [Streptomyces sp. NPDC056728]